MRSSRPSTLYLVAALSATVLAFSFTPPAAAAAPPSWCLGSTSQGEPCDVRVGTGPGGEVRSLLALDPRQALFQFQPGPNGEATAALPALRAYLASVQELLYPRSAPTLSPQDFSELSAVALPPVRSGEIRTLRFAQRFRGVPAVGPAGELRLAAVGGSVYALTGTPLDPRQKLLGLGRPPELIRAEDEVLRVARKAGLARDPVVEQTQWVAIPHRGTMGYKAAVLDDDEPPIVVAHIYLGYDFTTLTIEPEQREVGGTVRAREMSDDPTTGDQVEYDDLPTLIPRPGEIDLSTGEARHAYRMGSDLRLAAVGFGGGSPTATNAEFIEALGGTWFSSPAPEFTAAGGDGFALQDRYHKLWAALGALDPLMAEVGWEHDAGIGAAAPPPIVRPAELLLLFDTPCIGPNGPVPGVTSSTLVDQATQELMDLPHYSPWHQLELAQPASCVTDADCNAHLGCVAGDCVGSPSFAMSTLNVCTHDDPFVLFHELGHYFDRHAAYGFLSAVDGEQCVADSADEAGPLGETVATMTALYLLRRLYPELPYTLDTMGSGCSFGDLDSRLGPVIHDSCLGSGQAPLEYVRNFQCERPDSPSIEDDRDGCGYNYGYTQAGIFQAWWQLLNGQSCEIQISGGFNPSVTSVSCTDVSTGPGYEDRWMGLLLHALAQGNQQSYDELFDTIEGFAGLLNWFYPAAIRDVDLELLAHVRDNHSIGSLTDYPSAAFPGLCPAEVQGGD